MHSLLHWTKKRHYNPGDPPSWLWLSYSNWGLPAPSGLPHTHAGGSLESTSSYSPHNSSPPQRFFQGNCLIKVSRDITGKHISLRKIMLLKSYILKMSVRLSYVSRWCRLFCGDKTQYHNINTIFFLRVDTFNLGC